MTGGFTELDKKTLLKRFGLPTVCFVLVAIFLTNTLISIARKSHIEQTILTTLENDLHNFQDTTLAGAKHNEKDGVIYVLAEVQSSGTMSPIQVANLEGNIEKALKQEVSLIVRSKMVKEISALGSDIQLSKQRLDGSFINQEVPEHVRDVKIADTTIRNFLAPMAGYTLDRVRTFKIGAESVLIAYVYGVAPPTKKSAVE